MPLFSMAKGMAGESFVRTARNAKEEGEGGDMEEKCGQEDGKRV